MTWSTAAFDALAEDYDARFDGSAVGTIMRQAVWRRLDARFAPGHRVLELNCGTGEDAIYLARRGVRVVATDGSEAMLERARLKVDAAGVRSGVELQRLVIERISHASLGDGEPFDGVLSNFGGLNCVTDLAPVAEGLAGCLRQGAVAVLCVMGPTVLWEWGWYLARGQPTKAFRRLRPDGTRWHGSIVRYPSLRRLVRSFRADFRLRRVGAIGALVPPTYAESWAQRHRKVLAALNRWERRLETWRVLVWLADHYVAELERR